MPVYASDWIVTPGLAIGGTYSDNIELAPAGEEQSSFVAETTPQLSIRRTGRRLNLGFDYNLQALYRAQGDQTDVFNQFAGDARAELLREWFFLDFVTTYTQQNILATELGGDNIANRGGRTNVFTYAVSPFLAHRFGTLAAAE
ncbi:MAG: TIGR03016 family PEP-CTERM system-associated outer membrane protein, partial [Gammaproteobacteria bacterium]